MTLNCGSTVGPYEVVAKLGAGGMGEVYHARDPRLERDVAIKVLPDRFARDDEALARFRRESKAVAALSHPNIRAIHDIGTESGQTFAVMEFLEGQTLAGCLERSPLEWRKAVRIAAAIADGLAAAHAKGIIHRDIKPQNIFLTTEGTVKILDFGLARLENEPAKGEKAHAATQTLETVPGAIMGTVQYMSPEQVRGRPADARSDIFAFGCVLYESLTSQRPFSRETAAETMTAILHDDPPDLMDSGRNIPEEVQRVVTHCLEKNPAQRFQSARDLAFALGGLARSAFTDTPTHGQVGSRADTDTTVTPDEKETKASVAVLPLADMSPQKDQEYFCDGLAEELISALSKIEGLHVASRTSAFFFKGKQPDLREIGERLKVKTVLEGSVRKAGDRLRIAAQLVNVEDGYHLWSETFDRQMEDVFAVQDEIAQAIARALRVVLSEKEKQAIAKAPTSNVQAYEHYLRGRQFYYQCRRKSFETARRLFTRASELDPGFAAAYAGLADCCSELFTNFGAEEAYLKEADRASRRALELDPDLAEAHIARGLAVSLNQRYDEAQREFEIALRQNPGLFEVYYAYARSRFAQGHLQDAARLFEKACELQPENFCAPSLLATVYDGLNRPDDAKDANRRALQAAEAHLQLFPDDGRALYYGGFALIALGDQEIGLQWTERALAADPEEPLVLYNVACTYALLGRADRALERLDQAITFGYGRKDWMENDPDLAPLRSDPRFQTLLDRL